MTQGSADGAGRTTVAQAYLAHLAARGIDCLYLGSGSDTAPLVHAYESAQADGARYPKPVVSAHECVAIGMAHGYTMVTGRPQAVMLHVSVGTANAVCGLINAARANIPMLFTAGRTPLHESGAPGARDSEIHWAQEMFDQAGMVREFVKWDYELRTGSPLEPIVDRALAIACAAPQGPVYLTLPREVLAAPGVGVQSVPPSAATAPAPDLAAVAVLARKLAAAQLPVICCTASGADPSTVAPLVDLCERFGIGVAEARSRHVCFPGRHPLHLGHDNGPVLAAADALLYLESDVPWVPARGQPQADAFVAHAGVEPLFPRYPVRTHRSDLTLTTSVAALLPALAEALEAAGAQAGAAERLDRLHALAGAARERAAARLRQDQERGGAITRAFLSHCLAQALPADAIVVNEYPAVREYLSFDEPGRYFVHAASAGLGWGLPAALGAQQAAPRQQVVALLGDGSYLFANPAACHHAAALHSLPVVTIVFNNGGWGAVQNAARGLHPKATPGGGDTQAPLSSLAPMPDLEFYAQASGGLGLRVTQREALPDALRQALRVARDERRQVLVNVLGEG